MYCGPGKFGTVISVLKNSTGVLIDGLFLRANPYAGIGSPGGPRWPNNTDHEGEFSYDTDVALGGGIAILGKCVQPAAACDVHVFSDRLLVVAATP